MEVPAMDLLSEMLLKGKALSLPSIESQSAVPQRYTSRTRGREHRVGRGRA